MRQDIQDRIDSYVQNKLTADEYKAFEEEMHNDEKLRQEVELTLLIAEGFRRKGEQDAINEIQQIEEDELKKILVVAESKYKAGLEIKKNNQSQRKYTIHISALIGVAACLLVYIGFQPKYSSDKLFAEYFKAADYVPIRGDRGMDEDKEAAVAEAFASYQNGNYSEASDAFTKTITGMNMHDVPEEVIFYFAISLVETGQYDKAIEKFSYLARKENSEYGPESEFNLAMVYLKSNLRGDAEKVFRAIIDHNGPYTPLAKELLYKVTKKKWQVI